MDSELFLQGLVSSHVFGGSQGILPRIRSAVAQASAYFQGLQDNMAEPCPYGSKGPDKAQMIMLCLSIYLKACLSEVGSQLKCKHHLGSTGI